MDRVFLNKDIIIKTENFKVTSFKILRGHVNCTYSAQKCLSTFMSLEKLSRKHKRSMFGH